MPSAAQPKITTGQSLDVQTGIANIGENRAELEALANANIDGQDTFPQSVSTKRLAADDINVSGIVKSGSILVGTGGVAITSSDDGSTPDTGLYLGSGALYLLKAGVPTVTLDGATGDATITGAITATSGTFTGTITASTITSMTSVSFDTDVTINGDLILKPSLAEGYIYWGTSYLGYDGLTGLITNFDFSVGGFLTANGASVNGIFDVEYQNDASNIVFNLGDAGVGSNFVDFEIQDTGTQRLLLETQTGDLTVTGRVKMGATPAYAIEGPDATNAKKITVGQVSVSVTGTGAWSTATWTHGFNTGTDTVYMFATAYNYDTTKVTGISNQRIERVSTTTSRVNFLVATYAADTTVVFDIMAIGPA